QQSVGTDRPIIVDFGEFVLLVQGPDSAADEVAGGLNGPARGHVIFDECTLPVEAIWQPALRMNGNSLSDTVGVAGAHGLDPEIDVTPPAGEIFRARENIGDVLDAALHAPKGGNAEADRWKHGALVSYPLLRCAGATSFATPRATISRERWPVPGEDFRMKV